MQAHRRVSVLYQDYCSPMSTGTPAAQPHYDDPCCHCVSVVWIGQERIPTPAPQLWICPLLAAHGGGLQQRWRFSCLLDIDLAAACESLDPITTAYWVNIVITDFNCCLSARLPACCSTAKIFENTWPNDRLRRWDHFHFCTDWSTSMGTFLRWRTLVH